MFILFEQLKIEEENTHKDVALKHVDEHVQRVGGRVKEWGNGGGETDANK